MSAPARNALRDRDLLAQVELLVLFNPRLQDGPNTPPPDAMTKATHMWLTVDVHGRIARGELTGQPVVEDMRLEANANGEDVSALLEPLADEIANYIVKE